MMMLPDKTVTDGGAGADGGLSQNPGETYYNSVGGGGSPRRSVSPTNTIMVPPSLLVGQAPRYDEVYYPRTDKRMISKYNLSR